VIASCVGGNPELIDDGENGLLFEVGDVNQLAGQLSLLLDDPARRDRMAEAASAKMAADFTYSQAAATMQQIYESILTGAHR
jgi:glycosyltransferase involved in cell wall biosynthesis